MFFHFLKTHPFHLFSRYRIEKVTEYIEELQIQVIDLGGSLPTTTSTEKMQTEETPTSTDASNDNNNNNATSSAISVPVYDAASGAEDYDKAGNFKQEASDFKAAGDYVKALENYNQAVVSAPPSALLYSNRAICLIQLEHYKEAEEDCNRALELNPDSGKALKTRGQLRFHHLNDWQGALSDLSQAQSIDFDPEVAQTLKELTKLRVEEEKNQAKERLAKEDKMRKRAEDIRKAQQEEKSQQQEQQGGGGGGMPGGMPDFGGMGGADGGAGGGMPGMGGGMPGMGGMDMGGLMSMFMGDPEIQEGMKNPKVMAAFSELMSSPGGPAALLSDPTKLQKIMSDPEVGPVLQKIMGKLGGGMGGMGGGMPGGAPPGGGDGNGDDIPDLGDLPEMD
jgi:suppressor of tumorigenicity protein 13